MNIQFVPGTQENEYIDASITDGDFSYGFQWKQLFMLDGAKERLTEIIARCRELDKKLPVSINWKLDFDIPAGTGFPISHIDAIKQQLNFLPTVPETLDLDSHKEWIKKMEETYVNSIRSRIKQSTLHLEALRFQLQDLSRLKPAGTSSEWKCQLSPDFVPFSIGFSWYSPTNPERRGMTGLILADAYFREGECPATAIIKQYQPFTKHT